MYLVKKAINEGEDSAIPLRNNQREPKELTISGNI
jgi:hypothetical protein